MLTDADVSKEERVKHAHGSGKTRLEGELEIGLRAFGFVCRDATAEEEELVAGGLEREREREREHSKKQVRRGAHAVCSRMPMYADVCRRLLT
jgi:hypothetical protein